MAAKRPKLCHRAEDSRASARNPVRIIGTCRSGDRAEEEEILVTDISPHGCRLQLVPIGVAKGAAFVLTLGDEAPVTGRLKWVKQGSVGVAFDAPLEEAVLERLLAAAPPSNVIPLRRSEAG